MPKRRLEPSDLPLEGTAGTVVVHGEQFVVDSWKLRAATVGTSGVAVEVTTSQPVAPAAEYPIRAALELALDGGGFVRVGDALVQAPRGGTSGFRYQVLVVGRPEIER